MSFVKLIDNEHNQSIKFIESLLSHEEEIRLKSFCFSLTKEELEGEIIDMLKRFLDEKCCPMFLSASLINLIKVRFLTEDLSGFALRQICEGDILEYDAAKLTSGLNEAVKNVLNEILLKRMQLYRHQHVRHYLISDFSIKNMRRNMEDRHIAFTDINTLFGLNEIDCSQSLFAVFDGHGGIDASNYAASHLLMKLKSSKFLLNNPSMALKEAVMQTDADFLSKCKREKLRCGSTAVVVLIQDQNLTVAWLGDSQVVLCKGGNAVQLMDPHKPDREDERQRIETLGGCVVYFNGWRVNGQLSVSRAIGDCDQKPFISSEPDVEEYELEGDEEFLILACDGLWDNVEPVEAVQLVNVCIKNGSRSSAAEQLVMLAKKNKSEDNITVLIVYLDVQEISSKIHS
ncbi:protein phosphatase 1E [Hydra vulgaris]|nr:protein phosphatase 1E [Hydra vulgaris]